MKMRALLMAMVLAVAMPAFAETGTNKTDADKAQAAKPVPDPVMFKTTHTGTFGSEKVAYTVEAGETYIKDEDGDTAAVMCFAFTCDRPCLHRPGRHRL